MPGGMSIGRRVLHPHPLDLDIGDVTAQGAQPMRRQIPGDSNPPDIARVVEQRRQLVGCRLYGLTQFDGFYRSVHRHVDDHVGVQQRGRLVDDAVHPRPTTLDGRAEITDDSTRRRCRNSWNRHPHVGVVCRRSGRGGEPQPVQHSRVEHTVVEYPVEFAVVGERARVDQALALRSCAVPVGDIRGTGRTAREVLSRASQKNPPASPTRPAR